MEKGEAFRIWTAVTTPHGFQFVIKRNTACSEKVGVLCSLNKRSIEICMKSAGTIQYLHRDLHEIMLDFWTWQLTGSTSTLGATEGIGQAKKGCDTQGKLYQVVPGCLKLFRLRTSETDVDLVYYFVPWCQWKKTAEWPDVTWVNQALCITCSPRCFLFLFWQRWSFLLIGKSGQLFWNASSFLKRFSPKADSCWVSLFESSELRIAQNGPCTEVFWRFWAVQYARRKEQDLANLAFSDHNLIIADALGWIGSRTSWVQYGAVAPALA